MKFGKMNQGNDKLYKEKKLKHNKEFVYSNNVIFQAINSLLLHNVLVYPTTYILFYYTFKSMYFLSKKNKQTNNIL